MNRYKRSKRVNTGPYGADIILLLQTGSVPHRPLEYPVIKLLPEKKWTNTNFSKLELSGGRLPS